MNGSSSILTSSDEKTGSIVEHEKSWKLGTLVEDYFQKVVNQLHIRLDFSVYKDTKGNTVNRRLKK